jgi:hypothetical protein
VRRLLGVALLMGWFLVATPVSADPMDGTVTGTVTSGTAGGTLPAGDAVTLVIFSRKDQALVDQRTTPIDANGQYQFTGLDRDPNFVYFTLVHHDDVTYPTAQPFQLQDAPSKQADIQVFDTTQTDDGIQLPRLNLLIAGVQPGMLQMMQMGAVANSGDRTFVTPDPQDQALAHGLQFGLPKGAMGAQFQTGFANTDIISALGGLQVTSPVLPGQHEFALAFQVPYNGSDADLSIQVPYSVGALSIYVPAGGPQLSSSQLTPGSIAQMGNQSYQLYTAQNVNKGTMLTAKVSGLPSNGGLSPTQLAFIGLGAALFVLGAGILIFGTRRAQLPARPTRLADLEEERLQLVVRLAALDERFAAGGMPPGAYAAERERGKQRLVELTTMTRSL